MTVPAVGHSHLTRIDPFPQHFNFSTDSAYHFGSVNLSHSIDSPHAEQSDFNPFDLQKQSHHGSTTTVFSTS